MPINCNFNCWHFTMTATKCLLSKRSCQTGKDTTCPQLHKIHSNHSMDKSSTTTDYRHNYYRHNYRLPPDVRRNKKYDAIFPSVRQMLKFNRIITEQLNFISNYSILSNKVLVHLRLDYLSLEITHTQNTHLLLQSSHTYSPRTTATTRNFQNFVSNPFLSWGGLIL